VPAIPRGTLLRSPLYLCCGSSWVCTWPRVSMWRLLQCPSLARVRVTFVLHTRAGDPGPPPVLPLVMYADGVISSLSPWMTCTRAGSPGPSARRARPVHPPRPGEAGGAHLPGPTPGRGRARRGPRPARDLRPLKSAADAPTGRGEPDGVSEPVTASPDQPVDGRLAWAGGSLLRLARVPRPTSVGWGRLSVCGRSQTRPGRETGYLVPVPTGRPAPPGTGLSVAGSTYRPIPCPGPYLATPRSDRRGARPTSQGIPGRNDSRGINR
jgi:hypothetical protein